jgi:hypothetical protein
VAVTTVPSSPDDGCKGHPKHVEDIAVNEILTAYYSISLDITIWIMQAMLAPTV